MLFSGMPWSHSSAQLTVQASGNLDEPALMYGCAMHAVYVPPVDDEGAERFEFKMRCLKASHHGRLLRDLSLHATKGILHLE